MLLLRPLLRTSPTQIVKLSTSLRNPVIYRTMASTSAAPLLEWLVIAPDHSGALQKRLALRQKHLDEVKADREDMWLWGGMFLFSLAPVSIPLHDLSRSSTPNA